MSFIPKYGETAAFALEANFAIKLLNEFLRDYVHSRHDSITNDELSMPGIPIFLFSTSFVFSSYFAIGFAFLYCFALIKFFLTPN